MLEDSVGDAGQFGGAGAEVAGGGSREAWPSRAWIWGRVGAVLAESGCVGVAQPVRRQPGHTGGVADGEHDLVMTEIDRGRAGL